ncbi:hypothetical protein PAL_GLEAN10015387 [Pteropus alecto]|uniref:Uncharacterized protein n=1 Tax=Pteropus alecto TaxID=9402 RepID=L5KFG3_PTEAL|nr:hypothetical protein PAL_GLEAN10015387 [Pteropus alecto]
MECGAENPESLFTNMRNCKFQCAEKRLKGVETSLLGSPAMDSTMQRRDHTCPQQLPPSSQAQDYG